MRQALVRGIQFVIAAIVLAYFGYEAQMVQELTWLGAILLAAAIVYVPVFVYSFVAMPHRLDQRKTNQIADLKRNLGLLNHQPSFDMFIEEIRNDEADRRNWPLDGIENHYRIGVTNITSKTILRCYVLLEDVDPPLQISPSVKLRPVDSRDESNGSFFSSGIFNIAASETRYLWFISRHTYEREQHQPPNLPGIITTGFHGIIIDEHNFLAINTQYHMTVAVHAPNANSRRLRISVCVDNDGVPRVEQQREIPVVESSAVTGGTSSWPRLRFG